MRVVIPHSTRIKKKNGECIIICYLLFVNQKHRYAVLDTNKRNSFLGVFIQVLYSFANVGCEALRDVACGLVNQ